MIGTVRRAPRIFGVTSSSFLTRLIKPCDQSRALPGAS